MAGAREILARGAELHRHRHLLDHHPGLGPEDVGAQDAVAARFGEDLDEALHLAGGPRARVGGHGKAADTVIDAGLLELLLGAADGGHFGMGEDHGRDGVVVDVDPVAGEELGDGHALLLGLVREHGPADDVADGVDPLDGGPEAVVDGDAPGLVAADAERLEAEAFGAGPAPHGHEHGVGRKPLRLAPIPGLDDDLELLLAIFHFHHPVGEAEREALSCEDALQLLRHLAVHARRDAVEELHHRDFGAKPPPHGAEFETDVAGADDEKPPGHVIESQRAGGGEDAALVDLDPGQRGRHGAGGDDDVPAFEDAGLPLFGLETDPPRRLDAAMADEMIDAVLAEEEGDSLRELGHRPVLAGHHGGKVEGDLADADAVGGEPVAGLLVEPAGVEQGLGGNAADVETGAAQGRAAIDAGDPQAELRRPDGADIAAGAAPDDDEIVWLRVHVRGPAPGLQMSSSMRCGSSMHSLMRTRKRTASRPSMMRWS